MWGGLISEDWVLTAAHCIHGRDLNGIDVIIGLNHRNQGQTALHYSHVDQAIPHENHAGTTEFAESFDIALLHLQDKAVGIPTLSLFNPNENGGRFLEEIGSGLELSQNQVTIMGFGTTERVDVGLFTDNNQSFKKCSPDLVKTSLSMRMRQALIYYDKVSLFDSNGGGRGIGKGDSGGPAIFTYMNRSYLLGVCVLSTKTTPNLFSSTSYYFPWIQKMTGITANSGTYNPNSTQPVQRSLTTLICSKMNTRESCDIKRAICAWYSNTNECKPRGS